MVRSMYSLAYLMTLAFVHHALAQNPTVSLIPLVDDVRRECAGGQNDGLTCTTAADCELGPDCQRFCTSGSNQGLPCSFVSDCDDQACPQRCSCNYAMDLAPGQTITTEIVASNWSPKGETLAGWQACVDNRSAAAHGIVPLGWHPGPVESLCEADEDCEQEYPICWRGRCVGVDHAPEQGAFVDNTRSDYVFFGLAELGPVMALGSLTYGYASVLFSEFQAVAFEEPRYCGSLKLVVEKRAHGKSIISLNCPKALTLLLEPSNAFIEPLETEDLTINISNPSDVDGDGDADLSEYGLFQACFGKGPPFNGCVDLDFDNNNIIDVADHAAFLEFFYGP